MYVHCAPMVPSSTRRRIRKNGGDGTRKEIISIGRSAMKSRHSPRVLLVEVDARAMPTIRDDQNARVFFAQRDAKRKLTGLFVLMTLDSGRKKRERKGSNERLILNTLASLTHGNPQRDNTTSLRDNEDACLLGYEPSNASLIHCHPAACS